MHSLPKEKYKSWLPHGFDLQNAEKTNRRLCLQDNLRKIFKDKDYKEITLPNLDYTDTFKLTRFKNKQNPFFELRAGDGEQLAVCSDLTVQVIKAVANGRLLSNFDKNDILRFFYMQPVLHDHPWGSGKKREIMQAGVELLNYDGYDRVFELLELARACVASQNLEAHLLYGDVRVLEFLFRDVPQNCHQQLSLAFHNKDIALIRSLSRDAGVDKLLEEVLTELPLLFGGKEVITELKLLCKKYPDICKVLTQAEAVENVVFDFSIMHDLSYYTGPIFEAYLLGTNEKLFTGGVYDRLLSKFSNSKDYSACGFAIDLSLLVEKSNYA